MVLIGTLNFGFVFDMISNTSYSSVGFMNSVCRGNFVRIYLTNFVFSLSYCAVCWENILQFTVFGQLRENIWRRQQTMNEVIFFGCFVCNMSFIIKYCCIL